MDFTDKGMLPQIGNHFDKAKRESKDDLENSKDIENYDRFQNKLQSEQETPEMSKNQEEGGENSRNGEEIKDEAYYAALSKKAIDEELIHLRKDFWFTRILVQKTWIILV